jgi:hypothetical protein
LSFLPHALRGKLNRVLYKLAHLFLQKGIAVQFMQFSFYAQMPENARAPRQVDSNG